ncbi:exodeoxyribonuclease V subunit alpha [Buchnera aphidicola]|uniref:exodeoxyribonuclease V subunit alpha n=1 Tax=Buchnera aphidicola TaxID=9 RepID=UPI003BEEFBC1
MRKYHDNRTIIKRCSKKKIIQPIDFYFSEFISEKNSIIMLIAACLSYESRNGKTFLSIDYFKNHCFFSNKNKNLIKKILNSLGKITNWLLELSQSHAVSDGSSITPLILYKNKLYLYKMWKAEKNILKILYLRNNLNNINIEKFSKILKILFPQNNDNMQKIAVTLSLLRNILFIIGSPGTGKTTTIIKIIIALIKNTKNKIKIQLAAPTGKAASRLNDILQDKMLNILLDKKEQKNIPSIAITLHKLFNIKQISYKNIFNKINLLKLDVLIIDESSMIDLLMMEHIFFALSKETKIIFIGDHHQLPPIETGSILKDLCYYANDGYSPEIIFKLQKINKYIKLKTNNTQSAFISNSICVLKENHRFHKNSGIHIFANAIHKNEHNVIKKIFTNKIPNIVYYNIKNNLQYKNMISQIIKKYKKYWILINQKENMKSIINQFQKYQVLCLLKNGMFGVTGLNEQLEYNMHQKKIIQYYNINHKNWYIGKPIIITKNNKYLDLYNGNIGITNMSKKNILQVSFLENKNSIKNIPVHILQDYETAWALTVHKAQGSEFNHTILVLPNTIVKIFNKDLLYTAATRSKEKLSIYGEKKIFFNIFFKMKNIEKVNKLII